VIDDLKQKPAEGEVEEGLTIKGDLRESGLPELLKSLTQGRETGILTLSHDGVDKSIHLKEGKILFAASTDPDDRLGEVLMRSGKITLEQYFESAQHIRPGRRQGSVLVELGSITPDDLVRGVRDQVMHIVHSLFQWTRGEYKMVLKDLDTHDLITLNLTTPTLIFEGVRTIGAWSRIYRGLGSSLEGVLQHAPDADNVIYEMDLGEDESHLYGVATGKLTIWQLCSMSYLTNFETCQCLWGFLCVGALAPAAPEQDVETDDAPRPSDEVQAVLRRLGSALQTVREALETTETGSAAAFLDSALRQVSQQHPEVFQKDMSFDGLAQEVLQQSGTLPGAPDAQAAKIETALFAMLMQIRLKRGPELEGQVSRLITPMLHPSPESGDS
jgi:hypothetical protein